ncbi:hypothetical protein HK107_00585 [Parvularcula sp. ZS-1/3]|uniref:Uncharacterized protein n=1 Tax=Parvularcula mediterranea TaxID=2732508 RepID=A0A7Y3RJS9_9PROT|nr:hypothetical protein [Parvularcula mediterranea]NNU14816.1 hypothetical protein [Parvularcula mediterranea]
MGLIGNILRGIVLAVIIAVIAGLGGAMAAKFLCANGCAWAVPPADLVAQPAPGAGGGLTMAMLFGGLSALGLAIALIPQESVKSLATVFTAAIAFLAFLVWLPRAEAEAEPEPEPILEEPEVEPDPVAQVASCSTGEFQRAGNCVPCYVTDTVEEPAKLAFESIDTGAYWQYAKDDRVMMSGSGRTVGSAASYLASDTALCSAEALLVYGSASADGSRERNVRRARDRAENLAEAIRRACTGRASGLRIYALSLGQSEAPEDVPEDRALAVSLIQKLDTDAELSGSLILDELGYAVASGGLNAPLIERRERFPRPWAGPNGNSSALDVRARPMTSVRRLADGAPASCTADRQQGLDPRTSLRQ